MKKVIKCEDILCNQKTEDQCLGCLGPHCCQNNCEPIFEHHPFCNFARDVSPAECKQCLGMYEAYGDMPVEEIMKRETYEKTVESKTCEKKTCREKTNWVLTVTLPPEEGKEPEILKGFVCPYHCLNRGEE